MIDLTTQCPQCRYRFDVSLEQLQQRKGLLRCAQCAHIFDAYECAVTSSVSTPIKTSSPLRVPHLRTHFIGETPLASGIEALKPKKPKVLSRPIRSDQPIQALAGAEINSNPYSDIRIYLDTPTVTPSVTSIGSQAHGLVAEPSVSFPPKPPKPKPYYEGQQRSSGLVAFWRVLLGVLLLIMAAQLLYIYRVQIANSVPFTRPVLQWLCDGWGCELPYMREVKAIEVRQSSLQEQPALSSGTTYAYRLQLQLKNNLAWPQEWPTLVLSFNDAAAAGMATMAIEPSQYLPADQVGLPFAAGAQQSIRLPVVINGKKINGFSVDKYYP